MRIITKEQITLMRVGAKAAKAKSHYDIHYVLDVNMALERIDTPYAALIQDIKTTKSYASTDFYVSFYSKAAYQTGRTMPYNLAKLSEGLPAGWARTADVHSVHYFQIHRKQTPAALDRLSREFSLVRNHVEAWNPSKITLQEYWDEHPLPPSVRWSQYSFNMINGGSLLPYSRATETSRLVEKTYDLIKETYFHPETLWQTNY